MLKAFSNFHAGARHGNRARFAALFPGRSVAVGRADSNFQFSTLSVDAASPQAARDKQQIAAIRLYRILQRTGRSFGAASEDPILIQPRLMANDWGRHVLFKPPTPTTLDELFRLFYVMNDNEADIDTHSLSSIDDWYHDMIGTAEEMELPPMTSMTCWTTQPQLQRAIRAAFKVHSSPSSTSQQKWAIRAIQMLQEQQLLWRHSSVATTNGVRVTATSCCIGSTSPSVVSAIPPAEILEQKFRFAYRMRVENVSDKTVQLLGRYWHIQELTDDGEIDDAKPPVYVDAPATGAVGHLPVLRPGHVFEYMSGTDMSNRKGRMQGHFYMATVPDDTNPAKSGDHVEALSMDTRFQAEVAPFSLEAN